MGLGKVKGIKVRTGTSAKASTGKKAVVSPAGVSPILIDDLMDAIRTPDSGAPPTHLRASSVGRWCPRAEAIERAYGDHAKAFASSVGMRLATRGDKIPAGLAHTFMLGKGIHEWVQNEELGLKNGRLFGQWECHNCGAHWGTNDPESWIPHPLWVERTTGEQPTPSAAFGAALECKHRAIRFRESYNVDPKLRLSGHMDGSVARSGGGRIGLEIKSISEKEFAKLRSVKSEQKVQATIYCHLFGFDEVLFLYVSKGWSPDRALFPGGAEFPRKPCGSGWQWGGFKEFRFKKDPKIIAAIQLGRERIAEYVDGKTKELPPRVKGANSTGRGRCGECPKDLFEVCWAKE